MKKINQELIALFDKYGSARRRALRENKKLSYLYALADLRENLLDWYQFDPEQQALQIGADAGALSGLLARRLSRFHEQKEAVLRLSSAPRVQPYLPPSNPRSALHIHMSRRTFPLPSHTSRYCLWFPCSQHSRRIL